MLIYTNENITIVTVHKLVVYMQSVSGILETSKPLRTVRTPQGMQYYSNTTSQNSAYVTHKHSDLQTLFIGRALEQPMKHTKHVVVFLFVHTVLRSGILLQ